ITPLLNLWETLPGGELNWPPEYPKMPGEPPRVQPSKKVEGHWNEDGGRIAP
ncbi:MAG: ATP-dependent DNA ligase, partial [Actinomycetota bacterium]|nr:ATP-dependent DNA ligase [Actinomycetota bacterium]